MHEILSMILALRKTVKLRQVKLIMIGKAFENMLEIFSIARYIQGHSDNSDKMMNLGLFELFRILFEI